MRSSRYHTSGPAWKVRLVDDPAPQPEPTPEPEMPRGQMIHILRVRVRTAGDDSLFAKALHCLEAVGSDEPDAADRTANRESGYMHFNEVTQVYSLLPAGHWKAGDIARAVAKQYEIHEITFRFKSERSNMGSSASCSCQGWNQIVSRKRGDDDRLRRCASEHLDAVKRGTWKRPRPLHEFLNEIFPPQFNFNSGSALTLPAVTVPDDPGAVVFSTGTAAPGMNSH